MLNHHAARVYGDDLLDEYIFAEPYPHIVIDNFLPDVFANNILQNFPGQSMEEDVTFKGRVFEHNKRQIFPHACKNFSRNAFSFFNSSPFLEF